MGKIISLNNIYRKYSKAAVEKKKLRTPPNEKSAPLSDSMIKTLKLACIKQNDHLLFGPADIEGSSAALIERGLLKNHKVIRNGNWERTWYVTKRARILLKKIEKKEREID